MITRIVKMSFRPEEAESFEALFESRKTLIAGSVGCHSVELLKETTSTDDGAVYFTRSIWDDETSLEKYRASALFAEIWPLTKAKFAGKPEAWTTKIV
ncbi:MAG: heme-degrading monooxygenase HmoA [Bacteroidia bacterium]|jgi:heme-degrading monooxygenase HmoA